MPILPIKRHAKICDGSHSACCSHTISNVRTQSHSIAHTPTIGALRRIDKRPCIFDKSNVQPSSSNESLESWMSPLPERKRMKGVGRVAFMAQLADITADLEAGWPMKAVYQKCADKLGISYAQFARYVDQIVRRGARSHAATRAATLPAAPPPRDPMSQAEPRGTLHAGHQPARRGFNHNPLEQPDDRRRLLGEG
jgi:Family of unknown function (DUF5338)